MKKLLMIVGALAVIGAATGGALYYAYPVQVSTLAGLRRNYVISLVAPAGSVTTELNAGAQRVAVAAGFTHLAWPTKIVTAKVLILGLDGASGSQ